VGQTSLHAPTYAALAPVVPVRSLLGSVHFALMPRVWIKRPERAGLCRPTSAWHRATRHIKPRPDMQLVAVKLVYPVWVSCVVWATSCSKLNMFNVAQLVAGCDFLLLKQATCCVDKLLILSGHATVAGNELHVWTGLKLLKLLTDSSRSSVVSRMMAWWAAVFTLSAQYAQHISTCTCSLDRP